MFPGDTLVTKMWKESDTRIVFETSVKEHNEIVIKNAVVELYKEIPQPKAKAKPVATVQAAAAAVIAQPERLTAADVFSVLAAYVGEHPELAEKTKTVFQFTLKNPASSWVLDLKNGQGSCAAGVAEKADVTLELDEEHLGTVVSSTLADVQKLFFGGKLKIGGNIMASNKLIVLQDIKPQRFEEAKAKRLGSSSAVPAPVAEVPAANGQPIVADIFTGIDKYIALTPGIVEKVKTLFQFKLSHPDGDFVVDMKNGKGSAWTGEAEKPDVTLSATTADFVGMCTGAEDAQKLFFSGKLKIAGNMMAAQKLEFLKKMDPKLVEQATAERLAAGGNTNTPTVSSARMAFAPALFAALMENMKEPAGLNQPLQFNISEPEAHWLVDFSQSPAAITATQSDKAAATFGLSDENLAALAHGRRDVRDLYQRGELRVDGDARLAHKLQFLTNIL